MKKELLPQLIYSIRMAILDVIVKNPHLIFVDLDPHRRHFRRRIRFSEFYIFEQAQLLVGLAECLDKNLLLGPLSLLQYLHLMLSE